jgi:hypothetical protein
MSFSRRRTGLGVLALVATGSLVLGAVTAAQATPVRRASLSFNLPVAGSTVTTLAIGGVGASSLSATVVTGNGGRAVTVASNWTNAIDFPAYVQASQHPPFAIVSLRNKSSAVDSLNPGYGNWTWQADFSIDDNVGTEAIDGDNVLQRGLSPQKQWKLSVDEHRAVCTVRTTANGPVSVTPAIRIPLQTTNVRWYRGICNRSLTGVLTLRVYAYSNALHGWVSFASSRAAVSASGSLGMSWWIPVSVGGKLTDAGAIQTSPSTDQFNGRIDNVILTVG